NEKLIIMLKKSDTQNTYLASLLTSVNSQLEYNQISSINLQNETSTQLEQEFSRLSIRFDKITSIDFLHEMIFIDTRVGERRLKVINDLASHLQSQLDNRFLL